MFFLKKKKKNQQQYEENISNKWTHNLNRNSLNFQLEKMKENKKIKWTICRWKLQTRAISN